MCKKRYRNRHAKLRGAARRGFSVIYEKPPGGGGYPPPVGARVLIIFNNYLGIYVHAKIQHLLTYIKIVLVLTKMRRRKCPFTPSQIVYFTDKGTSIN